MFEMIKYEEMAVKAILSFGIAILVVLCGLSILGIEILSCNLPVLAGGTGIVALVIWLFSVVSL